MSRWKKEDVSAKTQYMREWLETEEGKAYRKKQSAYTKEWRKKNRERFLSKQKENYDKTRIEVLTHYSGGIPKCSCCGETGLAFLSLDHINGDGSEHRKKIDPTKKMGGNGLVYWLKKNNYPEGIQVLCYNCNFAKRQNKECPHQTGRVNELLSKEKPSYKVKKYKAREKK